MRIFIGTHDVAGILTGLKQGFESNGCKVTTLIKDKHPRLREEYDYKILRTLSNSKIFRSVKNKQIKKIIEFIDYKIQNLRIENKFPKLLNDHDVFIFIWQSLLKNRKDYPLIKKANKKIITIFVGTDIRHISAFQQEFGGDQSKWEKAFHEDNLNKKLDTLRKAELYSDLIFSVPDQSGLALRPYDHFYLPFDLKKTTFNVSKNKPIKVVHAPSRIGIKGTEIIINTIERIKNEGIEVDFKLLQGIPNKKIIEELIDTDVLVDELYLHGPAMLSTEAMASGCAVATHTLSTHKDVFNPPVCNIDETNIYEQLKYLFTNEEYRQKLIQEGRKFVEENNSPHIITKKILEKINAPKIKYDYEPDFFLSKYKLPVNSEINLDNLELTKQVLLKYGVSNKTDTIRAINEKLIPPSIDLNTL